MKRIYFPVSTIVTGYGCLLLLLAFFLLRDNSLHQLERALPLPFILRFCLFWFISIVLAVVFYWVSLKVNYGTSKFRR